jgi:aminobenzoyl-glutamate utilization protein B
VLSGVWDRLLKISQGAALMTETTLDVKDFGGDANIIPNDALARVAQKNLEEIGGVRYTVEERQFALALQKSLPPGEARSLDTAESIQPLTRPDPNAPFASTDVGDVSWNVPTIGFDIAAFVPGVVAHTWQATASVGTSIGQKGMIVAAKAIATTAADLFLNPKLVADGKADFQKQLGGRSYQSVIPPGQKPPLDYRRK